MLRIIIDGSADMPEGWAESYQFDILPIPIQIGGKTYYQGEDIDTELFYQLVPQHQPQTGAPSPFKIKEFIEQVCDEGDTVLSIIVSSKLSATYAMVEKAALELREKFDVIPFDSLAGSAVLALMAREARLREKAGEGIESILESLKKIRDKVTVVLTVDSLEFAHHSGRVGAIKTALSSLLNIKPIITLQEGMMNVTEMVRTRQKSLERLVHKVKERFGSEPIKVTIVHSQDQETANELKSRVEDLLTTTEVIFTELSISVAANLGPKTVGIVALPTQL